MNTDELVDIYDESGKVTGFRTRSEAEDENLTTPNVIIFVFNSAGQIWLQQRSDTKKHYPGLWDPSACGGITHDEEPLLAAERELEEEMGLRPTLTLVETFISTFPDETGTLTRTRYSYLYVCTTDEKPTGSSSEVKHVRSFDPDELMAMVANQPELFVPCMDVELSKALAGYKSLQTHNVAATG